MKSIDIDLSERVIRYDYLDDERCEQEYRVLMDAWTVHLATGNPKVHTLQTESNLSLTIRLDQIVLLALVNHDAARREWQVARQIWEDRDKELYDDELTRRRGNAVGFRSKDG